jgi:hypothetical protein
MSSISVQASHKYICLRLKGLIIKGYYILLMRDWSSHNSSQHTNCLLLPKQKCPCNARLNETDYFFSANLTIILNHQLSKWVWRNMLMRIYCWEVLATTRIYIYIYMGKSLQNCIHSLFWYEIVWLLTL